MAVVGVADFLLADQFFVRVFRDDSNVGKLDKLGGEMRLSRKLSFKNFGGFFQDVLRDDELDVLRQPEQQDLMFVSAKNYAGQQNVGVQENSLQFA